MAHLKRLKDEWPGKFVKPFCKRYLASGSLWDWIVIMYIKGAPYSVYRHFSWQPRLGIAAVSLEITPVSADNSFTSK